MSCLLVKPWFTHHFSPLKLQFLLVKARRLEAAVRQRTSLTAQCLGEWWLIWLPSGYVKIAIENGPVEIVSFPMKSMVIFHSYVNVYQRVPGYQEY